MPRARAGGHRHRRRVIGGVAGGTVAWISGEDAEGILRGVATGTLSGVVAGLFPQSLIGAVAGGALASAAVQTYELSLGWRCSYSGVEIARSAGIGGAAHGAGVAAAPMAPRVAGFFRGSYCFAAGTPIATREGSKPIEEIRASDTVRTADPATGQQSYGKVVRTFVGEVEKILEVETADGARVKATEGHPFFVEGRGFVAARKLARGDLLRRVDGRRVAVVGLGWEETRTRVYNFEVEGTHTYYAAGVWVHNARRDCSKFALDAWEQNPAVGRPHVLYPLHGLPTLGQTVGESNWDHHVMNLSPDEIVTDFFPETSQWSGLVLPDYLAKLVHYPNAVGVMPLSDELLNYVRANGTLPTRQERGF